MEENKKKTIPLNEIFLDPNLSIEELEERLELAESSPWICIGNVECSPICQPVVQQ